MFEAMILDSIPKHTFDYKKSAVARFPTCCELSKWFEEHERDELLSSVIINLLEQTKKTIYSGFDIPIELGSNISRDSNLYEYAYSLIERIHIESQSYSKENAETPIAVERESAILLIPETLVGEITWPSCVRVIRVIRIPDLCQVCVLHHQSISGNDFIRKKNIPFPCDIAGNLLSITTSSCDLIVKALAIWRKSYRLVHWDTDFSLLSDGKYLDWYRPHELFEAHYAHLNYRNIAATTGDESQLDHFQKMDEFIERFFRVEDAEQNIVDRSKLECFKAHYFSSHYRKMAPYEALLEMYSSHNGLVGSFLRINIEDSVDFTYEIQTVSFIMNWEERSQVKRIKIKKQKKIQFSRTIYHSERRSGESNYIEHSHSQFTLKLNEDSNVGPRWIDRICKALNHGSVGIDQTKPHTEASGISEGGIWISSGVMENMDDEIASYIAVQSKKYAYFRTMCCALPDELKNIENIVGTTNGFEVDTPSNKIVFWNPPAAAAETSPHFVYVGSQRRL